MTQWRDGRANFKDDFTRHLGDIRPGRSGKSLADLKEFVDRNRDRWATYNVLRNNCWDYAKECCNFLGVPVPSSIQDREPLREFAKLALGDVADVGHLANTLFTKPQELPRAIGDRMMMRDGL